MERLIDPVIADMQCEHDEAVRLGRRARRVPVILAGYLAFWKVLICHAPAWLRRVLARGQAPDRWPIGRALGYAAVAMFVLTSLLTAPPLLGGHGLHGIPAAWLFLLLVPQAIPITLPVALLVGVSFGIHNRPVTSRIHRAVLVAGLAGSLATFGTIVWLVPAANQTFRVTVAREHVVEGPAELSISSLRERAVSMKQRGFPRSAGNLLLSYHLRLALVPAALIFALFALDVARLRARRGATIAFASIPFLVYASCLFWLSNIEASTFSHEAIAVAVAWVPNVILVAAMRAFAVVRRRPMPV
jgi:lipopolysaccharide export LptBFGC system permease protein LptF